MRTIKVMQGQSLFDVAIMWLGSALGAVLIAGENDLSITETLEAGQELRIPNGIINQTIVADFAQKQIRTATAGNKITDAEGNTQYAVAAYVPPNYWI